MSEHEHTAGGRLARWRERGRVKRQRALQREQFALQREQDEPTAYGSATDRLNGHARAGAYGTEGMTFWSALGGGFGGGDGGGGGGCGSG